MPKPSSSSPQMDGQAHPLPSPLAEIAEGWKVSAPACAAVVPLGLALGVLVVQSGLAWWWAPLIAAVVFAGSVEFLLVGMFAAVAPLTQVALSTLLVNFRHIFYAVSFPLHRVNGKGWKAYATFALTDEAYALTTGPEAKAWSRTKIITIQATFHLTWILAVTLGAGLGILVPPQVVGLEFAVTALFVVLALEAYNAVRSIPVAALAFLVALVATLISKQHMLAVSMGLFVALLVASFAWGSWRQTRA